MPTNKIGSHDCDNTVFHENNVPTAEQVGAMPIVDCTGSSKNLDIVMKSGKHRGLYLTDSNTLGTPYKQGITSETSAFVFSFANSTTFGVQFALVGGEYNKLTFIRTMVNGVISDWTTGFLPLTGGTIEGKVVVDYATFDIKLPNAENRLRFGVTSGGHIQFYNMEDASAGSFTSLYLRKSSDNLNQIIRLLVKKTGGDTIAYNLFGEHNKPNGTYTGNGSATQRTINTGGIGNVCFIWGYGYSGFVTPVGVFAISVTSNGYYYDTDTTFENGVLTIASTSNYVNKSATTYNYQVA